MQNKIKHIKKNTNQIKKNTNLLQNILAQVKKWKRLFEKGLKKIAKMCGQSRDEPLRIAKIRRNKNY